MISHVQYYVRLRDFLRLIRVEDYGTFMQLVIGFALAGGQDWGRLLQALFILGPCVYGGLYTLNDLHDMDADRMHPIKCTRPVASGRIAPQTAAMVGAGLISFGVGTALMADLRVFAAAMLFVAVNLAYTFRFKSVPYIEILMNTVTHPMRFAAGLLLAGSWEHWALLGTWTLAVFAISTLKRIKEMRESSAAVRPVLAHYDEVTLKKLIVLCLLLMLAIWPFTWGVDFILNGIWLALTTVAVVGYFRSPWLRRLEEYLWR